MKHTVELFVTAFFIAVLGGLLIVHPVFAAPTKNQSPIGNDISYPQCGKTLPGGQAFGIVGVNGGKATVPNPCLTSQLKWASMSSGIVAAQSGVQLYVNTANPGEVIDQIMTWPKSGNTPYGACDGTNSLACSWQYGRERAEAQLQMLVNATAGTTLSSNASDYIWWLDVETENTWQSGSSDALARNRATLEAMTSYFQEKSAKTGLYSTSYQWGQIAGGVSSASNLFTLDSWLAGARTQKSAQTNCKNLPLVAGGKVVLSQYVSAGLDYDLSCV